MNYYFPDYYHTFRCIGKDCPDTCCGGWKIPIDSKSLLQYRRLIRLRFKAKGSTHAFLCRLRKAVDFRRRNIRLSNRYCPLLTKDKLCGMYLHMGRKFMCHACRIYPRHQEEFGNVREVSLSLSCPEAARIILSQKTRPQMLTKKTNQECPKEQQVDGKLLQWLTEARDVILDILWESPCALETSVPMALAFCHDLQSRHRERCFYQNERFNLKKASKDLQQLSEKYAGAKRPEFSCQPKETTKGTPQVWLLFLLELYSDLEPVVANWPELMASCRRIQGSHGIRRYEMLEKQLLTYFIQVYFPGAIYDDNLFDKMLFAVAGRRMIGLLAAVLKKENDSSNPKKPDDFFWIQAAYLYSREVENSDWNLNKLFQGFDTWPYFNASMAAFT